MNLFWGQHRLGDWSRDGIEQLSSRLFSSERLESVPSAACGGKPVTRAEVAAPMPTKFQALPMTLKPKIALIMSESKEDAQVLAGWSPAAGEDQNSRSDPWITRVPAWTWKQDGLSSNGSRHPWRPPTAARWLEGWGALEE